MECFMAVLLVALAAPAIPQTKPTINIRRDGRVINVYLPECADFCGFWGNFDLAGPSSLLGDRGPLEIDTRGFAGTIFGKDGDYFMHPTLKRAVLASGQQVLQAANGTRFTGTFMWYTLYGVLYVKAVNRVFGDGEPTAEKIASILLVAQTTPAEWASGVFPFRREYRWDYSRPFSAGQKELVQRIWRANFFTPGTPAPQSPRVSLPSVTMLKPAAGHSALRQALQNACITADDAATRYLAYTLSGTGLSAGPVRLEMGDIPEAVHFHLRPDLANAVSIGDALKHGERGLADAYTERDVDGVVIGNAIFALERPLINYINSYFHGELCRN